MQKIVIDNFGPIKHAEIELTELLVLIGEQATGKSTIAKLIYFFKTLSNDFLSSYYAANRAEIDLKKDIIYATREKFYDYFGSTHHLEDFIITYNYSEERNITLKLDAQKNLFVRLSNNFFCREDSRILQDYKAQLGMFKREIELEFQTINKIELERKRMSYLQMMSDKINDIFCNDYNDMSFIVAGRNATVSYSNFFEGMMTSNLQQIIENQGKRAYNEKEQTIDETLMLDFLQRVSKMRQLFNKYGGFDGYVRNAKGEKQRTLAKAHKLVNKVIRGEYTSSADEKIVLEDGKYVYLKNASSGQQESIRILQDAFLAIMSDNDVLRIIEEPEAHIYPEAQMYMLQLLAMVLNNRKHNQIIITTHSPYVLSVINNLMYAYKVGQKSAEEVEKIVGKESWISPSKVNAYMLTSNCSERIIDDEQSMIMAEKIDGVSRTLNDDFDKLLDLDV